MDRCSWLRRVRIAAVAPLLVGAGGCYLAVGFDSSHDDDLPDIRQQPQSLTVIAGQRASFAVSVASISPVTLQWRRDGADIPGANQFTYITPATTLADDGTLFTVQVCNVAGCVTSSPALLAVLPP